jgi:hypothetical protein
LFNIDVDFQVGEALDGFEAVGCGGDIAKGALFATLSYPPRERILLALQASERFNSGVRGPFVVESL